MKFLIFLSFIVPILGFGQCREFTNQSGVLTSSSTPFYTFNSIGKRYNDTISMVISKKFDGVDYTYSIKFTTQSNINRNYLKYVKIQLWTGFFENFAEINCGESELDKGFLTDKGKYYYTVESNISEKDIKRFFFADGFNVIGLADSYEIKFNEFKTWKELYKKCIIN